MSAAGTASIASSTRSSGQGDSAPARSRADLWRGIVALLGEFWKAHPVAALASLLLNITGSARSGLYLVAIGGLIDSLVRPALGQPPGEHSTLFWVALYAATTALEAVYWLTEPILSAYLADHGTYRIGRRILERAASAPLIQFEHGEFFDHLTRASSGHGRRVVDVYRQIVVLARVVFMLGAIAITLVVLHPALLPLLVAGSVPALWLQMRVASAVYAAQRAHTTADRVRAHLQTLLTGKEAAAEVRLFGTAGYLLEKWRALRERRQRDVLVAERHRARLMAVGNLISGAAYAGALVLVAALVLQERLSIGAYVAVATGALWFQEILGGGITALRSLEEQSQFLGDLFDFLRVAPVEEDQHEEPQAEQ